MSAEAFCDGHVQGLLGLSVVVKLGVRQESLCWSCLLRNFLPSQVVGLPGVSVLVSLETVWGLCAVQF